MLLGVPLYLQSAVSWYGSRQPNIAERPGGFPLVPARCVERDERGIQLPPSSAVFCL